MKFQEDLRRRETARLRQLEEQFRTREAERETANRKAREHCEQLEQKLQRALLEVERHEARVIIKVMSCSALNI